MTVGLDPPEAWHDDLMTTWLVVWTGAMLFLASLAIAAHAWVATWGAVRPLTAHWPAAVATDALLLTVFAVHHSLFARERAKTLMGTFVPPPLARSVYVWIASLLLIVVVALWRPVGGRAYEVTGAVAWLLRLAQLVGLLLIAGAIRVIDGFELAGIRMPRSSGPLYARGPYGLVRHPLYLGWVLIVIATPSMTGDRLTFAVLTIGYLVVAIPWEEQALRRLHGADYTRYMRQVRWRVLPFVY